MKQVRCFNTGGYNLTEGNEYQILREENGFYILTNDRGRTVRYSDEFFEDIVEEAATVARTEADVIRSIEVEDRTIVFTDINGDLQTITNPFSTDQRMRASCGIKDVAGLNDFCRNIDTEIDRYEDDDYLDLRKALFTAGINKFIKNSQHNAALYALSTAISDIDTIYIEKLDELATMTSEIVRNPNSGNDIKLWVFNRE